LTIRVDVAVDGRFGTNSYLVTDDTTMDAVVIDANVEPEQVLRLVRQRKARVRAILLTHTDLDHIGGLSDLIRELGPLPVAVHDAEHEVVTGGKPLRREFALEFPPIADVVSLIDGEPYKAGSLELEVMHTPGHSPGGVSLKIDRVVFTGDALFAGSIGRSDFRNSDGRALIEGIRSKLLSLPDDTIVYSGHGPPTTIGQERRHNPFLQ
jgi:glyoxylase-like metal-dependent hydrolase (beta-lactamase superfamily II)